MKTLSNLNIFKNKYVLSLADIAFTYIFSLGALYFLNSFEPNGNLVKTYILIQSFSALGLVLFSAFITSPIIYSNNIKSNLSLHDLYKLALFLGLCILAAVLSNGMDRRSILMLSIFSLSQYLIEFLRVCFIKQSNFYFLCILSMGKTITGLASVYTFKNLEFLFLTLISFSVISFLISLPILNITFTLKPNSKDSINRIKFGVVDYIEQNSRVILNQLPIWLFQSNTNFLVVYSYTMQLSQIYPKSLNILTSIRVGEFNSLPFKGEGFNTTFLKKPVIHYIIALLVALAMFLMLSIFPNSNIGKLQFAIGLCILFGTSLQYLNFRRSFYIKIYSLNTERLKTTILSSSLLCLYMLIFRSVGAYSFIVMYYPTYWFTYYFFSRYFISFFCNQQPAKEQ